MARSLRFTTQPSKVKEGETIDPPPVVTVFEGDEPDSWIGGGSVSVELVDGQGAVLSGETTRPISRGSAEFSDLSVDAGGEYRLRAICDEESLTYYPGLDVSDAVDAYRFTAHGNAINRAGSRPAVHGGNGTEFMASPVGQVIQNTPEAASMWEVNPSGRIVEASVPRTIIVLAKPGAVGSVNRVAAGLFSGNQLNIGVDLRTSGGLRLVVGGSFFEHGEGEWGDGPWFCAALVHSESLGRAYLNGEPVWTLPSNVSPASLDTLRMGRSSVTDIDRRWTGGLAEVAWWNRILTPEEILIQAQRCGVA